MPDCRIVFLEKILGQGVEYSLRRLFTETYSNEKPGNEGQPRIPEVD